jgi:inhibitor of KinA sporulation pathway (predicted exonuclease)
VLEQGKPAAQASSVYVRPERSPITPFCTHLTGITRERVANEPNFARLAPRLQEMAKNAGVDAWVSWGQDQTLLHRQSLAADVENPFETIPHVDIKRLLSPLVYQLTGGVKPRGVGAGVGLETAMKQLGIPFEGRAHSGAVDALNAASMVAEVRRLAEPYLKAEAAARDHVHSLVRRARP